MAEKGKPLKKKKTAEKAPVVAATLKGPDDKKAGGK